jgi:hypothetical protein
MRASHRDVRPRFIDKDQMVRILPPDPPYERRALGCHIRPVDFGWARAFFLSTKPARWSARWKLARVVRCARDTRRLYSQHNSLTFASGPARTTAWRTSISMGQRQDSANRHPSGGVRPRRSPAIGPPIAPAFGGPAETIRRARRMGLRHFRTPLPLVPEAPRRTDLAWRHYRTLPWATQVGKVRTTD